MNAFQKRIKKNKKQTNDSSPDDTTVVGNIEKRISAVGSVNVDDFEEDLSARRNSSAMMWDQSNVDINLPTPIPMSSSTTPVMSTINTNVTLPTITETTIRGGMKRKHSNDKDNDNDDDDDDGHDDNARSNIVKASPSGYDYSKFNILFVEPMLLKQSLLLNDFQIVQDNILTLKKYLNDISGMSSTLRTYFVKHNETNALKLGVLLNMLSHTNISAQNFNKFNDMIFKYYIMLIENLPMLTQILVNVNYTRDHTNVSYSLTRLLNNITDYMFSILFDKFETFETLPQPNRLYVEMARQRADNLHLIYNINLLQLRSYRFYKYTLDNDTTPAFASTDINMPTIYPVVPLAQPKLMVIMHNKNLEF
ncbi:hypothetical protein [Perigonia lusca single nucleopolyhedrovirus]|uniref:Uncharacterized protein n=1 Tax=Perigonia lusca single nucleopolyhedrovirus TaxID=1675865 RepID=A0A0M3WNU3_9ABAC|nr:hypothetical protein [Perigonia lusca single nucleopolyhedrovirus]AKN80577.1 hypothetical protein [Perigonia lusca single nucleopolyhedrovirus]